MKISVIGEMAFCYKLKLNCNLAKKLRKIVTCKLTVPSSCILSKLRFGYSKLEEEEQDPLVIGNRSKKVLGVRLGWRRRKYTQF